MICSDFVSHTTLQPRRGDIIIFKFPDDESEKYVKRIIGLPGEKVTIKEAKVYINDSEVPLEEDYLKEDWVTATGPFEFEVPEDCYFVMGDNRNDSYDARYWDNTYVTKDEIIGKAYMIYYPFSRLGSVLRMRGGNLSYRIEIEKERSKNAGECKL